MFVGRRKREDFKYIKVVVSNMNIAEKFVHLVNDQMDGVEMEWGIA